jgi:hypothetical protein
MFNPGDKIFHAMHGYGRMLSVNGNTAEIRFDRMGVQPLTCRMDKLHFVKENETLSSQLDLPIAIEDGEQSDEQRPDDVPELEYSRQSALSRLTRQFAEEVVIEEAEDRESVEEGRSFDHEMRVE